MTVNILFFVYIIHSPKLFSFCYTRGPQSGGKTYTLCEEIYYCFECENNSGKFAKVSIEHVLDD